MRAKIARPGAAQPRHAVAGLLQEAAAPDQVGAAVAQPLLQLRDLGRVVLAVAVHLDSDVVALDERVAVARLHGAADAEVEGVAQHRRAGGAGALGGRVGGAVVHDQHVEAGRLAAQLVHDLGDRLLLVQGGHHRDLSSPGAHRARKDRAASAARAPAFPSQSGICGGSAGGPAASAVFAASRSAAGIHADQRVRAQLDRDRALGVVAVGQARDAQRRGLLLQAARVGDHQARVGLQRDEVRVVQRLDQPQALGHGDPRVLQPGDGARVGGEEHRQLRGELAQDRDHLAEPARGRPPGPAGAG